MQTRSLGAPRFVPQIKVERLFAQVARVILDGEPLLYQGHAIIQDRRVVRASPPERFSHPPLGLLSLALAHGLYSSNRGALARFPHLQFAVFVRGEVDH